MVRRTSPSARSSVHAVAERDEPVPGLLGEGQRHPRRFAGSASTFISKPNSTFGRIDGADDRRGRAVMRRGAERQVAFAAEQARGRVEPDPSGARQIDFRPGMQIGEIVVGAFRPLDRIDIGLELDEIAGDEARREAEAAQHLHQEPGGIAAGARSPAPGFPPASARRAPCGSRSGSRCCRRALSSTRKSMPRMLFFGNRVDEVA